MYIKDIYLQANDLARLESFYTNTLELPVQKTDEGIKISAGSSSIIFSKTDGSDSPYYHFAFLIPKNLFHESLEWARTRVNVLNFSPVSQIADFTGWNAKAFYFHDSQQNILEFIAHYDLPDTNSVEFSSSDIQSIHETGIVTDDVTDTCERLTRETGTPYYRKGPRISDFAVMGDEQGLFIVSKTLRGWLPTMAPAKKFPLTISFMQGEKEHTIHI